MMLACHLTLWCLMLSIPFTQCDAQDAEHQFQVTTFSGLHYVDLI
jgi:hypothetical protein